MLFRIKRWKNLFFSFVWLSDEKCEISGESKKNHRFIVNRKYCVFPLQIVILCFYPLRHHNTKQWILKNWVKSTLWRVFRLHLPRWCRWNKTKNFLYFILLNLLFYLLDNCWVWWKVLTFHSPLLTVISWFHCVFMIRRRSMMSSTKIL